jgi:glycosyltransferase involved in cell wall biosynthesis
MPLGLIVNSSALRSSMGVRRLYAHIVPFLDWPTPIEMTRDASVGAIARVQELLRVGRKDAIFWSPTHRGPLRAHHHVVSVHDCINIEYVYSRDWRLPAYRRLFNAVLTHAETIVALSHATRDAILRNYTVDAGKIEVIAAGFDPPARMPITAGAVRAANRVPQGVPDGVPDGAPDGVPFVLMVTNGLAHKNTEKACGAFIASDAAKLGLGLRVVGSVSPAALALLSNGGAKYDIYARVDDATLTAWYRGCAFLFSPTLVEGYNLPVAEAIASGANVLCSDIAAHREFFAPYAEFFDPTRIEAMVAALNTGLQRSGRWHAFDAAAPHRTFVDMAADYRRLFLRISQGASQGGMRPREDT